MEVIEECYYHLDVSWRAIDGGRNNLPTFLFQGNPCLEVKSRGGGDFLVEISNTLRDSYANGEGGVRIGLCSDCSRDSSPSGLFRGVFGSANHNDPSLGDCE